MTKEGLYKRLYDMNPPQGNWRCSAAFQELAVEWNLMEETLTYTQRQLETQTSIVKELKEAFTNALRAR